MKSQEYQRVKFNSCFHLVPVDQTSTFGAIMVHWVNLCSGTLKTLVLTAQHAITDI